MVVLRAVKGEAMDASPSWTMPASSSSSSAWRVMAAPGPRLSLAPCAPLRAAPAVAYAPPPRIVKVSGWPLRAGRACKRTPEEVPVGRGFSAATGAAAAAGLGSLALLVLVSSAIPGMSGMKDLCE